MAVTLNNSFMLTIQNLSFGYNRRKPLFDNLSLTLKQGNIYGLLGRNGAGKSSFLRLMAGLLFPKEGTCQFNGIDTCKRSIATLENLYFLPEEFHTPAISISEFVNINSPFYAKFNHEQFENYLKEFQLSKSDKLSKLSYGQKKKVLIGFGLATNVQLLILDEPTNGLDIPSKRQFRKLIASTISDEQAIIVSTHHVKDLDGLIDNIIILEENTIVLQQSIEHISERLSFKATANTENLQTAFYTEQTIMGLMKVMPNLTHEHTKVDLELLFNAVLHKKDLLQQMFDNNLINNYHA
ncbi:ATP-binding cassette domain-containing protein [Emticicia sp. BO119]|uniref:ABC transporter ATP-binding protein n=1 Tax=Emticicia sp. BO119 TaxID=2757768 RepID=UPI001E5F7A28|nr:ABC transporter ATP-binding protein [Emticicia sp. BO119]